MIREEMAAGDEGRAGSAGQACSGGRPPKLANDMRGRSFRSKRLGCLMVGRGQGFAIRPPARGTAAHGCSFRVACGPERLPGPPCVPR